MAQRSGRFGWEGGHPDPPAGVSVLKLTRGYVAWVDSCDFELVGNYSWYAHAVRYVVGGNIAVYACAARRYPEGADRSGARIVRMHRLLCPDVVEVDHVSHSMLNFGVVDNRQSNLRRVSHQENTQNQRKCKTVKTSPFKGVCFEKFTGKWKSSITVDDRHVTLGRYRVEAYAAYMYDLAALRMFGPFALTNFPVPGSSNFLYG